MRRTPRRFKFSDRGGSWRPRRHWSTTLGLWVLGILIGAIAAIEWMEWQNPSAAQYPGIRNGDWDAVVSNSKPVDRRLVAGATGTKVEPGIAPKIAPNPKSRATDRPRLTALRFGAPPSVAQTFALCGNGRWANCVIDGDTFRLNGEKIRVAGIDAPEIHPSHCAREEELGQRAKLRLLELLNAGGFALEPVESDHDKYGRSLRRVTRDGTSLGDVLVKEGLARAWDGRRHPWCN
jgi:endonuclease YncB( thermonuclease family)